MEANLKVSNKGKSNIIIEASLTIFFVAMIILSAVILLAA
jgi:hypothetical protein